jgi:hypothetical protein
MVVSVPADHTDARAILRCLNDNFWRLVILIEGMKPPVKSLKQRIHGTNSLQGAVINAIGAVLVPQKTKEPGLIV